MQLGDYLKEKKITQEAFIAEMDSVTGYRISQGGLSKYILGQRIPCKEAIVAIHKTTNGAVTPNDFFLDL